MIINKDIRREAKANGVALWQIAKVLKISEPTMTRRLRDELPETEKTNIRRIISDLSDMAVNNG